MTERYWYDASTSAVRDENRLTVATLCAEEDGTGHLLAAAPELYEALEELLEQHDSCFAGREEMRDQYYSAHPHRHEAYKRARAALAAAKGEVSLG